MTVLGVAYADGGPGLAARGRGRDDHSLPAEALRQGGGEVFLAHPPGYGRGGGRACGMDGARPRPWVARSYLGGDPATMR
ncbi:hypothetical protein [Candidatus Chloroploca sp. Khr17]|uniref:hypothetical protein n=1 Tax=Candidatus Chloroploca sp. Khr17 TaxID=2496869 RepID=UPI00101DE93E|nr:hypothetical protein [Candidatus Chloroploca sp. Khr17]